MSTTSPIDLRRARVTLGSTLLATALTACVVSPPAVEAPPPPGGLYAMPGDLGQARSPDSIDSRRAPELAEAALFLLNPERPGGPDYAGAARMCLLAVEVAVPNVETDLRSSCFRLAARSALRSGDSQLYIQAVDRWDAVATRVERSAGEFAIHAAIRDRLQGEPASAVPADPLLRRLLETGAQPSQVSAQ